MIKLENVSKVIRGRTVLDNINITFRDGTVYGLRGINGSGKTMLMRAVSGLIYPTSGRVIIDGKCLGAEISFPEHLGLLLENPAFLDGYTGYKNLELLASLSGSVTPEHIIRTLRRVGLDPADRRKYRKYSLGMKQRLGIGAAILEDPDILIFDEPLNALDTAGAALFSDIMDVEKKKGRLVILSCHDDARLREYADVIVTMENGKIIRVEGKVEP